MVNKQLFENKRRNQIENNSIISINNYLQRNQINSKDFFDIANEIENVNMIHTYKNPLNLGSCWNCR